jgi:hypothetical protein
MKAPIDRAASQKSPAAVTKNGSSRTVLSCETAREFCIWRKRERGKVVMVVALVFVVVVKRRGRSLAV